MISKNLFCLFFLFISFNLSGQTFKPSKDKLYQSLIGDVYMLSLFVDTRTDYWEDEEIDYYYKQLMKSQTWLENQAIEYDQILTFENDYFINNKDKIYLKDALIGQSPRSTIKKALVELGYDNVEDFLTSTNFDFKKHKLKLLFFVKQKDRSHAYNYWSNDDIDLAIIYCRSTHGTVTNHHVISHEILHQFGAWDLYPGKSQTRETAKKAKELFPNSVMIYTWRNRENLEVDELTAWRIGWHYDYKKEYTQFDPNERPKSTRGRKKKGRTSIKFDLKRKKNKKKE